MSLHVAVQMDPIGPIDITQDSTFGLLLKAQERGHRLSYYTPGQLSLKDGVPVARSRGLKVRAVQGDHAELGEERFGPLSDFDVILLRQDPPFDMSYLTTTYFLELVHPKTLVVNDPFWVRNYPEKLLVTQFKDLTPPTLITRDLKELQAFQAEHGEIIVKPLFGNGGAGVFRVHADGVNLPSLHELYTGMTRDPFIAQRYLPAVREGDKRIILIDGKAVGGVNRIPAQNETRSNLHVGGRAAALELTKRDHEICEAIGPLLKEKGQIFVGIDVIGTHLTEINVTSPTGVWQMSRFDGIDGFGLIWDAIEHRRAQG
ncbi:glutathione synthase [Neomegalonema sp.]|uniref:glutathione synthase n=1 Tax=Neomegalonema sp. TaxID=2039713 RepID=UPI00260C72F2|nr:glutathione synthase [Neomegalonema sp.]MDD2867324.1 glutathione synthase [Neomegalonema sp.]